MRFIASALLALCVVSACQAATITQVLPFSGTPDYTSVLTFNQFDTQGGTLTLQSVWVNITLTSSGGSLKLDNDGAGSAVGSVEFGAQASITPSISMVNDNLMQLFPTGALKATGGAGLSLSADDGDTEVNGTDFFSYAGTDYGSYTGGQVTDTASGFVTALAFGQYKGTGTYTVSVNTTQVANYGALGGAQAQIDPLTTSGSVEIVYTYVPEPATMSLLALGGLAMLRRRK